MNETRTKLEYDGSTYELTNVIKDIFDSSVVWSSTPHRGRTVFGVDNQEDLSDRLLNWLNLRVKNPIICESVKTSVNIIINHSPHNKKYI